MGTGANQCGDQAGAFGPAALAVVRLSSESGVAAAWAAGVHRALAVASGAVVVESSLLTASRLPDRSPRRRVVSGTVPERRQRRQPPCPVTEVPQPSHEWFAGLT